MCHSFHGPATALGPLSTLCYFLGILKGQAGAKGAAQWQRARLAAEGLGFYLQPKKKRQADKGFADSSSYIKEPLVLLPRC